MRETDPRDCQHGEADATQEHIEQLQARIAQLEEALRYIDSFVEDEHLAGSIARTLCISPSDYLKQVRNQVREECMSSIAGVITRWQAKGYIIESSAGIMNDECIKAIRATKEE